MAAEIDKFVNIYRTLAQFPSISSGYILKNGISSLKDSITILSSWTQRNLERTKNTKFQQTHVVNLGTKDKTNMIPTDTSNEVLFAFSKSEKYRAVMREVQINEVKKFHLEIWNHYNIIKNISLDTLEIHGDVYSDVEFGSFVWSNNEDKLLYIAEEKVPKAEPFYKPKPHSQDQNITPSTSDSSSEKPIKGAEYVYRQDWGDQLHGKCQSVIVCYDLTKDLLSVLTGIPSDLCPGQVVWTPDDDGVVGVAWKTTPRKLGLIFCTCRLSYVFHLNRAGEFRILSSDSEQLSARSPRFSPDGKTLVWLERGAEGPHHACMRLVKYDWSSGKSSTVVDTVEFGVKIGEPTCESTGSQERAEDESNIFYGLYNLSLPRRCWLNDNQRLLLSTGQRFETKSYVVDIESNSLSELQSPYRGSLTVLDVYNDILLCAHSSLVEPSSLLVTRLSPTQHINWIPLTLCQNDFNQFNVDYLNIDADYKNETVKSFSALYLGPKSAQAKSTPLVIIPHGGPHSAYSNAYSLGAAFFAQAGYAVLLINYRGSTCSGEASVRFLPGKVGDADVRDCMRATQHVWDAYASVDPARSVLFGGSHGGFLVTHLSGQYPSIFRAVVSINPVTNFNGFAFVTDIPDWAAVEVGFDYETLDGPNTDPETLTLMFNKMRQMSPLAHVDKVVAPTLLLIGKKDLRVPASQGLHFYHRLKANNVTTKLLYYDDNHSLSTLPAEMDSLINTML
uniref:acylaminoacyl-peptidase n=1 Tax=Cacopsylla melanoneura TaxID=428564 RepID=A0A8D8QWV6_9HEMI